MPTRSKVQFLLPSCCGKMFDAIGTFCADLPAVLVREVAADDHAGARLLEGLPLRVGHHVFRDRRARRRAGSAARKMSCVFSWYTPPNHCCHITCSTPGTDSICGSRRIGSDCVNDTRAWVTSRVAPTKSAPAENSTFTRLQQAEQQEGRHDRQQRQDRAGLLAPEVGDHESGACHGGLRRPRPPARAAGPSRGAACGSRTRRPSGRASPSRWSCRARG